MAKRVETFWDGKRAWNITRLLSAYPELLTTPNGRLRLESVEGQREGVWVFPEGRTRGPDLTKPVIVLSDGTVIDGWRRIHSALRRGRKTLPCVTLNEEQERVAADNHTPL